jgi:transcription antitermination factor NusG
MSTAIPSWWPSVAPFPAVSTDPFKWYALLTRARHEKIVDQRLRERCVSTFLPLVSEVRRWSDRKKTIEYPLFSCYVFAKLSPTNEGRLRALQVDGVLSLVGTKPDGTPIPDEQIDAVRKVIGERVLWRSHPFLKTGQRVRIRSGAMEGVEGILVSRSDEHTFVVSIDAIQRSLAVRIEGFDVEPV